MKKFILLFIISALSFSGFSQNSEGSKSVWNTPNIQDNSSLNDPKIYPNPCKDEKITVEFIAHEISEIRIINIAGKEVLLKKFEFTENKKQVQLTEIPNGIYLLRIKTTDDKMVIKKLMVAKN
jgi:hypothetical protein